MIKLRYRRYLTLFGVICLGAFMRLCDAPPSSLWTDEFATFWISSAPTLTECIERAAPTQGQSPFFYVLEWGVLSFFQHNEFSLRFLSLAASLLSILLIFKLSLMIFGGKVVSGLNRNCDFSEDDSGISLIESDSFYPAIFAALLFSVNESAIYYAQEARPYALAVMFCLLSQIYFLKLLRNLSRKNIFFYILFSSLICYTHYIFGTMLLMQNIWIFYLFTGEIRKEKEKKCDSAGEGGCRLLTRISAGDISLLRWCAFQISIIITLTPLAFHLIPIIRQGDRWNWVPKGGLSDTINLLAGMLDIKFTLFACSLFLFLFTMKNLSFIWKKSTSRDSDSSSCWATVVYGENLQVFLFLLFWLLTPPFFAYFVTQITGSSLLDQRYMILSYIPFFMLGAWALSMLKTKTAKYLFISLIMLFYSVHILIPNFLNEAHFSKRIPHDWRGALKYMKQHSGPEDVIILRSGFIKENWVPETDNPIIKEYVKAPLHSLYFNGAKFAKIYNLTFSPDRKFQGYYQAITAKVAKSERIWIIGVSQPNNFPIKNIPDLFKETHHTVFEKDFSGVFLALMEKKRESVNR